MKPKAIHHEVKPDGSRVPVPPSETPPGKAKPCTKVQR